MGLGVGVGVGEGVGVGDGEAVTVGEGTGAGEPASSATDGTPHPARTVQVAMAKVADADLSSPRRCVADERTDPTEERKNTAETEGKMGVVTKASSDEKGWWVASQEN